MTASAVVGVLEDDLARRPRRVVRPGFRHAHTLPIDWGGPRASGEDARSLERVRERRGMCAADATVRAWVSRTDDLTQN